MPLFPPSLAKSAEPTVESVAANTFLVADAAAAGMTNAGGGLAVVHSQSLCQWFEGAMERERTLVQQRHVRLLAELEELTRSLGAAAPGKESAWRAREQIGASEACKPELVAGTATTLMAACKPEPDCALVPIAQDNFRNRPNSNSVRASTERPATNSVRNSFETSTEKLHSSSSTLPKGDSSSSMILRKHTKKLDFVKASRFSTLTQIWRCWPLNRIEAVVKSSRFELCFGCLIFVNTVCMAVEAQQSGSAVGVELKHEDYPSSTLAYWVGAREVFMILEYVFGVCFTLELLLKIVCYGRDYIQDVWNWIDTIIVASWLLTNVAGIHWSINPMLLRSARLVRLLRLARLAKTITHFDSLFLMTTSMWGSLSVLVWSIVLLFVVLMTCALFLQLMLEDFILDEANPEETRKLVFMYYGTCARTMLTMFEITLGNWMPACRALVENVNEAWMIFSILHKMVIGFSVVAVINSVFIQETFNVATCDDRILVLKRTRAVNLHRQKMAAFFHYADVNNDGTLTFEEFLAAVADPQVHAWLGGMDLDVRDVECVFGLLDDGDRNGELSIDELIVGVSKLKGNARAVDLYHLARAVRSLQQTICPEKVLRPSLLQTPCPGRSS